MKKKRHLKKPDTSTDQVNEEQPREPGPEERELSVSEGPFMEGIYEEGLIKGTRRIESSEVRPDKGM